VNTGCINVKQGDAAIISGDRLGGRVRGKLTCPPQMRRAVFVFESGLLREKPFRFFYTHGLWGEF
jgi:hypothetical protein